MGHNISNSTRRINIMAGPIGSFHEWTLEIGCPRCRDRREVRMLDLLDRIDGQIRVGAAVDKLRCSAPRCGLRPDRVVIYNRLHRVVLVGPGAL